MKKHSIMFLTILIIPSGAAMIQTNGNYCRAELHRFGSYEELKDYLKSKGCNAQSYD